MTVPATPATNLVMVHPQHVLRHPEATLHRPATEGHSQQPAEGNSPLPRYAVGKEVLHLLRQNVAGHDQAMSASRQAVLALPPEHVPFDLPDLRALVCILDAVALPGLLTKGGRVCREVLDLAGRRAMRQAWIALYDCRVSCSFSAQNAGSAAVGPSHKSPPVSRP